MSHARRSASARRSAKEWAIRGVLATGATVIGYVCVTQSLAQVVARSDAPFAHRLAPGSGRVSARLAMSQLSAAATVADRDRAAALARKALLQDPTAVSAVAALGINAEARGERAHARRLFDYAQKLSRRDLPTQFWAIENAVAHDDIAGALRHYDIALRTRSAVAADVLYPVLTSAASDPEIRSALIKTLTTRPIWAESFLLYVAGRGPDSRASAALFEGLQRARAAVPEPARVLIVNALIRDGFIDDAWRYYTSANRGADRRVSRDPKFASERDAPSAFDWVPVNDGSVTTAIQRGQQGGVFDFAAPATVGGVLLQQWQLLPPGSYQIAGHSGGIEQKAAALPYWVLTCRENGRELGRVSLPNSAEGNGLFEGRFTVPADCPVQVLKLVARPSDAVAGLTGQIDRVQLNPIGRE